MGGAGRRAPLAGLALASLLLAALLAGCGAANKTGAGASTPGSNGQASAAIATPTPNGVALVVAQTPTNRYDALRVIVVNGFATPIQVADHQSGCGIVTVERQSGGDWTQVAPCQSARPTTLVPIAPGASSDQTVQPGGAWEPGTYRVVLRYGGGENGGPAGVLYSQPFVIG